jgi:hypothetical protein
MTDHAPESSRLVRLAILNRTDLPARVIDRLTISTARVARRTDLGFRAVTTVERSRLNAQEQEYYDPMIMHALKCLPGFGGTVTMTMGRTYEVEWDGVCAPI